MQVKTVTIPEEEYKELLAAQTLLDCLYAAGVDNWEGFEFAQDAFADHPNKEDN